MSDFKLNRLDKRDVVLEEYSHCEVPAGCGGIVLRWVPKGGPADIDITTCGPDTVTAHLDGERLEGTRTTTVEPGRHTLGLVIQPAAPLAVVIKLKRQQLRLPSILSKEDGTWLATNKAPPPDWARPDFDAHHWRPMTEVAGHSVNDARRQWLVDYMNREGASFLTLGEGRPSVLRLLPFFRPSGPMWIRRTFTLTEDGLQ